MTSTATSQHKPGLFFNTQTTTQIISMYSLLLPFPAIAIVVYQEIRLAKFILILLLLIMNAFLMRRTPLCVRLKALGLRVLTAKGV